MVDLLNALRHVPFPLAAESSRVAPGVMVPGVMVPGVSPAPGGGDATVLMGHGVAPIAPAVILALCVVAGLATWLLLPGRRERAVRGIGGVLLLVTGLIFGLLLFRWTAGSPGEAMGVYFWFFAFTALAASVRVITHTKPVYSALYFVLTVFASAGLFILMRAEFMAAALVLIYAGAILITYVFVIMLASEATTGGVGSAQEPVTEHDAYSREPFAAAAIGFAVLGVLLLVIFDKSEGIDRLALPNGGVTRVDGGAATLGDMAPAGNAMRPGDAGGNASADAYSDDAAAADADASSDDAADTRTLAAAPAAPGQPRGLAAAPAGTFDGSTQELGLELINNQALNLQLSALILTLAMVGAITLSRRRTLPTGRTPRPTASVETINTNAAPTDDNPHSIAVYGTENPRQKAYPEN